MRISDQEQLEADRDANPTNLYLAIEEQDWDGVKYQADNFQEEARIWVCRRDAKTKELRWRVLPIHAAFLNGVPVDVAVGSFNLYGSSFFCCVSSQSHRFSSRLGTLDWSYSFLSKSYKREGWSRDASDPHCHKKTRWASCDKCFVVFIPWLFGREKRQIWNDSLSNGPIVKLYPQKVLPSSFEKRNSYP